MLHFKANNLIKNDDIKKSPHLIAFFFICDHFPAFVDNTGQIQ